jgi:hypothetical protein
MRPDARGRGGSLEQIRVEVAERLRSRRSEIEETIFAHVREAVPDWVAEEDAEYALGMRAAVSAAVDYGLAGIEHGEDWSVPIPSATTIQARRAARGGVGLDTVLLRYIERVGRTSGQRLSERVQRLLIGEPTDSAELGYELDSWTASIVAGNGRATMKLLKVLPRRRRRLRR